MAALSPLLRGNRLSLLPDCFWIIYRTRHWLWLDFYNTTERSAPRLLRHKAPHIKKEQHKEVATEGGAGCEQIVALSRLLYKSTHHALWDWQCNAFQRLNVNAILCRRWPVLSIQIQIQFFMTKNKETVMVLSNQHIPSINSYRLQDVFKHQQF